MTARLAIAAPRFSSPSETFIRDHVRLLAPGRTVLLCRDGAGVERLGCPALTDIDGKQGRRSALAQLVDGGAGLWGLVTEAGVTGARRDRIAAFLEAQRVRAVLAEYGPMGVQLMGACAAAQVPLFVHFHGYDVTLPRRHWYVRYHYRQLFRAAAGVFAPSAFIADLLRGWGCPAAKLHVSHNGVDPERFAVTTREPGRVVAVGRLVAKKAPHLTIAAFAQVRARFPEARLDLVGDGELHSRCRELVATLGLEDAVTLHGARPPAEVAALLARASLFVQHSVTADDHDIEGLPISILEAMAAGLPVVSTRHSGIPEAVAAGTTGILVDEGDVVAMAAAMTALLAEPDRAAALGRAGRERLLTRFTHARQRRRLLTLMGLAEPPAGEAAGAGDHAADVDTAGGERRQPAR